MVRRVKLANNGEVSECNHGLCWTLARVVCAASTTKVNTVATGSAIHKDLFRQRFLPSPHTPRGTQLYTSSSQNFTPSPHPR